MWLRVELNCVALLGTV